MDVEKLLLLVKDYEAIYDASRCEHRNCVLLDDDDVHNKNNSNSVLIVIRPPI